MLKKISIILIIITWPISLFLNNTFKDFVSYILPLSPKFAILPLIFTIVFLLFEKKSLKMAGQALLIFLSLILFIISFKPFYGQSIFISNNDSKQLLIQKGNLYNSIFLARVFQNKARIPLDKFSNNFFALTDPNNYFFGFAPGQIKVDNQNLTKFTFLSLPFILIGFYNFKKIKNWKLLATFLIAAIINLSLLTNFDRNDFVLWIPISLIIIHGFRVFDVKFKYAKYFEFVFVVFSLIEITKLFVK